MAGITGAVKTVMGKVPKLEQTAGLAFLMLCVVLAWLSFGVSKSVDALAAFTVELGAWRAVIQDNEAQITEHGDRVVGSISALEMSVVTKLDALPQAVIDEANRQYDTPQKRSKFNDVGAPRKNGAADG